MIYNWEFDDSVDFAPPHYRKSKYQKVEQLSKQIINEATALEYLEAFLTYSSIFFYCLISAGFNEWTHEYLKSIGELFIRLNLIGLPVLMI